MRSRAALAFAALVGGAAAACGGGSTGTAQSSETTTTSTTTTTGSGGAGGTISASTGSGAGEAGGPVDYCTDCALQSGCAGFANADINEASGLAASVLHEGSYYLHNDSGDSSRFFATNCAGDDLGTFAVKGAANVDWEDMAIGPCAGKSCLFFADAGDNDEVRNDYVLYRVIEPASLGAGKHEVGADSFPFAYPDGSHDSETLLVHPVSGEIAVVTKVKASGKSGVYSFPMPLTPGVSVTLAKTGEVAAPSGSVRFTGGSVHPAGDGILLRTYTSLFLFALQNGQTFGAGLAASPCEMPVMLELQGESVAWAASGKGYLTASEMTGQSLHFATCK